MNKSASIFKYLILALILIVVSIISFMTYQRVFNYQITAVFKELEPIHKSMPVFYKGYKIGRTGKVKLSSDCKYTLMKITLYPRKLCFPLNVQIKIRKLDTDQGYAELIYPKVPSERMLNKGSYIHGSVELDIKTHMARLADSGKIDEIADNASKALASLDSAGSQISEFFILFNMILEENRQNLKHTTEEFSKASENLNQLTRKLSDSIDSKSIKGTFSNINKSSGNFNDTTLEFKDSAQNIKKITENIERATKDLDKTVSKIDATTCEIKATAENARCITEGVGCLLTKRFAGLRIFFGKPFASAPCCPVCER